MIIKINKKNFLMNFSIYILYLNIFKFDYIVFDDDNNQMIDDSKICILNLIIIVNNCLLNYIVVFKLVYNYNKI